VTTGVAFGFGVLQTKVGGIEIVGVPLELLAGVGAHAAAFMGIGGKAGSLLHSAGNGALAAWAVTMGRGVGEHMNAKSGTKLPVKAKVTGESIDDDVMDRLSRKTSNE